ncbi:MAG: NUDIX domain-containing protein [Myxococcales bacterium]|nr:NUDIX domain-containing protein [Myxococcales bacterium]
MTTPTREAIPTWYFVVVVVRRGERYLLIRERKHGQTWYLPAGRVEAGERFLEAALRETLEESGVAVALEGVIRIEHRVLPGGARVRVLFTAHPIDDRAPKTIADAHSLEARWVTLDEAAQLPLRGDDVLHWLSHVARGEQIHPLSVLGDEA